MIIKGTIENRPSKNERRRIVAVGSGTPILGEVDVGVDGHWSLEVIDPVEWIVGQATGARIAAVAAPPQETMQLVFAEPVQLELMFEGLDGPAALWLDPLHMEEFPDELLWVLRAHADNIVDLHLAELDLSDHDWKLEIQPGRFRFSGGRFSFSDEMIDTNLRLVRVLDRNTGTVTEASEGLVDVDIFQPSSFLLTFGPPE